MVRILSIGKLNGLSNTCLHRHWALQEVGNVIDEVNTAPLRVTLWMRITYHLFNLGLPIGLPENGDENKRIRTCVETTHYDVVWIDKGITIYPSTLRYIKMRLPQAKVVSYSPDNMALRHNQSQHYLDSLPLYDCLFTNKSYILDDMKRLGAKQIHFVNNSFETRFHFPRMLESSDYIRLGGDVGFVGMWEKERCKSMLFLADHGVKVRVFGRGKWGKYKDYSPNLTIEEYGLYSDDYSKSFKAFKISLCFLRKMNYDQQTTRSVEIPACGGFMLAERTDEHLALFEEGKEAAYFSTNEELLAKCLYYLSHDAEREAIAQNGISRCQESDYSNQGMVRKALQLLYPSI